VPFAPEERHALARSSQLEAPVIVAVIAVWMMQMAVDEVINMVAVRDRLVAAAGAMPVGALDVLRALGRIRCIDRDHMLIDMIVMNMMQVAVVEIIDMACMANRSMAAIWAVLVGMLRVLPPVSNSANTPSMSRKHLPAAVLVSIGCSVALKLAPLALRVRTMSCRSPDRARQAIDACHRQHVALADEVEHRAELGIRSTWR
jgi:hypothetical protein